MYNNSNNDKIIDIRFGVFLKECGFYFLGNFRGVATLDNRHLKKNYQEDSSTHWVSIVNQHIENYFGMGLIIFF